ncbi:hypothetical protein GALMADRAFT_249675 [Galerina marginata CBS 339.88]|uniref:Uncharacterized protein n=1 Tax=Galerina marginata (strain CBS 339.88) TaxID=685588 RepID=A0A067T4B3_GALM3|nr:hypothetical protein GALMADRAFT_249675 [Galerina marginata CBS 339.88]
MHLVDVPRVDVPHLRRLYKGYTVTHKQNAVLSFIQSFKGMAMIGASTVMVVNKFRARTWRLFQSLWSWTSGSQQDGAVERSLESFSQ